MPRHCAFLLSGGSSLKDQLNITITTQQLKQVLSGAASIGCTLETAKGSAGASLRGWLSGNRQCTTLSQHLGSGTMHNAAPRSDTDSTVTRTELLSAVTGADLISNLHKPMTGIDACSCCFDAVCDNSLTRRQAQGAQLSHVQALMSSAFVECISISNVMSAYIGQ